MNGPEADGPLSAAFSPLALAEAFGDSPCAAAALSMFASGGKFLRPRLALAVHSALAGGTAASGAGFRHVMVAVECFHRASLVHDDIQDGDRERYGRPSAFAEYGVPRAVALGDWLVATGYGLLAASGVAGAMEAAARRHAEMCCGQARELALEPGIALDERETLEICRLKTGAGFALPAELGALAAGRADFAPALARFGFECGTAFQLIDDRADGDSPAGADAARLDSLAAVCLGRAAEIAGGAGHGPIRAALGEFTGMLSRLRRQ